MIYRTDRPSHKTVHYTEFTALSLLMPILPQVATINHQCPRPAFMPLLLAVVVPVWLEGLRSTLLGRRQPSLLALFVCLLALKSEPVPGTRWLLPRSLQAHCSLLSRRRRAGDGRGRTDGVEVTQARARQSLQRATLFHTCSVPGGGFPLNEEEGGGGRLATCLSVSPSLSPARSV